MKLALGILSAAIAVALTGCGQQGASSKGDDSAAPTEAGEGAAGIVQNTSPTQDQAGAPLSGGPVGQTPAYGEPGGAPSQVQSQRDESGPSAGDDNPPLR